MRWMETVSERATQMAGSSWALMAAAGAILVWLAAGPAYGFSDSWMLIFGTITSVITFVMVFVIQRDQNKQTLVLQAKLNELLAASHSSNRLIAMENMTEGEVRELHGRFQELAKTAARSDDPRQRLSVEHVKADEAAVAEVTGKPAGRD
jgi:low affinity Fe/Cu permease